MAPRCPVAPPFSDAFRLPRALACRVPSACRAGLAILEFLSSLSGAAAISCCLRSAFPQGLVPENDRVVLLWRDNWTAENGRAQPVYRVSLVTRSGHGSLQAPLLHTQWACSAGVAPSHALHAPHSEPCGYHAGAAAPRSRAPSLPHLLTLPSPLPGPFFLPLVLPSYSSPTRSCLSCLHLAPITNFYLLLALPGHSSPCYAHLLLPLCTVLHSPSFAQLAVIIKPSCGFFLALSCQSSRLS